MDPDDLRSPFLLLRIIYQDVHLVEVEAEFVNGKWAGVTAVYSSTESGLIEKFARDLMTMARNGNGSALLRGVAQACS